MNRRSRTMAERKLASPLADQMRPEKLEGFVGQDHLIGRGKPLRGAIETGKLGSAIFWGPPGSGKTTLAKIIARRTKAEYWELSAAAAGVGEVRQIIGAAEKHFAQGQQTLLFLDEIHRFNKAQQDILLPYVERGVLLLIGATTENPGFEVNAPLISRAKVYHFSPLESREVKRLLRRAAKRYPNHTCSEDALTHLAEQANGDARSALNSFEVAAQMSHHITLAVAEGAAQRKALYYDKKGDYHFDTISAFIKSLRGGSADGAIYYLARMLRAGEDPLFIARRMVIFASEDVANADPFALVLATSVMEAVHLVGLPEAQLILAQGAAYLANAPKSTAAMDALFACYRDLDTKPIPPIPLALRNPVSRVLRQLGAGQGYIRYARDNPDKFPLQQFLPDNVKGRRYYDCSHDYQWRRRPT